MNLRKCILPMVLCWLCSGAVAQQQQKPPAKPSPPTTTKRPSPGPPSERRDDRSRVLYLSGTVVMADSSALPSNLQVELLCGGRIVRQEHLSREGHFNLDLGSHSTQVMMDASASGLGPAWPGGGQQSDWPGGSSGDSGFRSAGLGRYDLNGCEVRVPPSPGLYANTIPLRSRSIFDNPDIGSIVVHRLGESGGTTVSLSTLAAPKEAKRAYEKAQKALSKKKPDLAKAAAELEKGVEIYPEFSEAWHLLGKTRLASGDTEGARAAFKQAVAADDRYLAPYLSLARLEMSLRRYEEVAGLTQRLLELNPHVPESLYIDGVANFYLGRLEASERSLRLLEQEIDFENHFRTFLFLGMIHAQRGQIPEAAVALERFLKKAPDSQISADLRGQVKDQLAQWEKAGLISQSAASTGPRP